MPVFRGMTKTTLKIACAPLAIAAMAALQTNPAAAQSQPQIVIDVPETTTEPTIVIPESEPVATPQPTVTAEPVVTPAEPVRAEPVVTRQEEPRAATTVAADAERQPDQSRNATSAAASASPVIPASDPSDAVSSDATLATTDAAIPTAEPIEATNTELAANTATLEAAPQPIDDGSTAALILALLGVGGVGLLAFVLMRRRKRVADAPVIERPVVREQASVVPAPVSEREPATPAYALSPSEEVAPIAASNGAAVELPRELPESFAERDSLLKRMIAARPDRANPFRSPRARAKRARLIMQSIGTHFTSRKPRIDLSQYTNIWPELRGWRPATA